MLRGMEWSNLCKSFRALANSYDGEIWDEGVASGRCWVRKVWGEGGVGYGRCGVREVYGG